MRIQPNHVFTARLSEIPDGNAGIFHTLKVMKKLVNQYKKSIPVRTLAVSLTNGFRQKDWLNEIRALHAFVRDNIRYVRDIRDVETLQTPDITLKVRAGDCDDKSLLLASMLESIGHPTRFVAIGFQPNDLEHVYVETRIGQKWIPLETTEPVEIGWLPKNIRNRVVIHN